MIKLLELGEFFRRVSVVQKNPNSIRVAGTRWTLLLTSSYKVFVSCMKFGLYCTFDQWFNAETKKTCLLLV